jgi:PilZ domain
LESCSWGAKSDELAQYACFPMLHVKMTQDRRKIHRYPLQIPVEIRLGPQGHAHANMATTTNISIRGIYFVSDQHCEIGTEFGATILLPGEITGGTDLLVEIQGKVERIDRLEGKEAAHNGIAVSIDHYNLISAKLSSLTAVKG